MKIASFAPAAALAAVLIAGSAGAALADVRCPTPRDAQWISIETVIKKAEDLGYSVKEAKRSDGCWEIEGYDRNGAEIEIHFDPVSGDVVKPRGWRPPARG